MKIVTYTVLTFLLLIVQQSIAQEKFSLEGTLTGFEDGVKFILCPTLPTMSPDRDHDTVLYLTDGKFRLEGHVEEPTQFSLIALPKIPPDNPKDFEAVSFWVENKPMLLNGEKGNLLSSVISGSEIQDQFGELMKIERAREKINKQIKDSVLVYNLSEEAKIPLRKIYYENMSAIEKGRLEFIDKHPDYLSCVAEMVKYINFMPEKISKASSIEFYQRLSYDFKNNVYGTQLKKYIGKAEVVTDKPTKGNKPYLFELPDSAGNILKLSSLKGKIILLDFWASGCGPCRLEHKNYLEAYQKYQSKGFEILSVSQDQSKSLWLKAIQKDSMIWKSVWDVNRDITRMYNITAIPTNYLISANGRIIGQDLRGEKLFKKLEELFKPANE